MNTLTDYAMCNSTPFQPDLALIGQVKFTREQKQKKSLNAKQNLIIAV